MNGWQNTKYDWTVLDRAYCSYVTHFGLRERTGEDAMRSFPPSAVERARDNAERWLDGDPNGYPRSWAQEEANAKRCGYELYDDFEAPPIAGYEALEREGLVDRLETRTDEGQERVHFVRKPSP